jgi:hypothetical protein
MKKITALATLLFFTATLKAQILGGIFNQNATQKQYMLQQIAALKVYAGYLQNGYRIARQGLNTIRDIKKGDLNLHTDYFNSLKTVSATVKRYHRVAEIIALQKNILKRQKAAWVQLKGSTALTPAEQAYISSVFGNLLDDCSLTIDELTTVTTNGNLKMKDDERLKRIDAIYADIQRKYLFVQAFSRNAQTITAARVREQHDVEHSRVINGIKK